MMPPSHPSLPNNRLIIAISGASGAIYGIRMLEILKQLHIETHLIISNAARITIAQETDYSIEAVQQLAHRTHAANDMAAAISSGSFLHDGMIIAPCSIRTMAEIATSTTTTLLSRAADVTLKERRKLVLMLRETPLHTGHLRQMTALSEIGAIIAPPVPAFYNGPKSIDDLVNHSVGRVLDLFDLRSDSLKRWKSE